MRSKDCVRALLEQRKTKPRHGEIYLVFQEIGLRSAIRVGAFTTTKTEVNSYKQARRRFTSRSRHLDGLRGIRPLPSHSELACGSKATQGDPSKQQRT